MRRCRRYGPTAKAHNVDNVSLGYGRPFRTALDGRWGNLDVEDCRNTARHFTGAGLADPRAVFISGASAGGYTALKAVCEDGPFALAVARSAIVDPERWTRTAPRFQRPHAAILSHPQARVDPAAVRRPVLLIHGTLDDVAPIEDAEGLATALRARLARRHAAARRGRALTISAVRGDRSPER